MKRSLSQIIHTAKKNHRIADGLVLCDLCDNPASLSLSLAMSWTGCAPCMFGEADSFDSSDLIAVDSRVGVKSVKAGRA